MIHVTIKGKVPSKSNQLEARAIPRIKAADIPNRECPQCNRYGIRRVEGRDSCRCGWMEAVQYRALVFTSKDVKEYVKSAVDQIRRSGVVPLHPLDTPQALTIHVYHHSKQPDCLNVKVLPDILQEARIVDNDRLFKEAHIYGHIDKNDPRAEMTICPWTDPQQPSLFPLPYAEAVETARNVLAPQVFAGLNLEQF